MNEGYQNANQNNSLNCCIAGVSLSGVSSASQKSLELRVSKRGVRRHMLQWNKLPCWRWGPAHLFVMSSSWRCGMCFLPMEDGDVKKPKDQPRELFRICFPLGFQRPCGWRYFFTTETDPKTPKLRRYDWKTRGLILLRCFPNYDRL